MVITRFPPIVQYGSGRRGARTQHFAASAGSGPNAALCLDCEIAGSKITFAEEA